MRRFLLLPAILLVSLIVGLRPSLVQAQSEGPTSCQQSVVDIVPYVAPCQGGTCGFPNASAVSNSVRHISNVNNAVSWINNSIFKQQTNEIHFLYELTGTHIEFLQDSFWDQFRCTDGRDAMYRVNYTSDTNWGAQLYKRQMTCGGPNTYTSVLNTFAYDPAIESTYNLPLSRCEVAGQPYGASSTNTNELFFQGPATCNGTPVDAIGIRNLSGAGAGEVYFYCKDAGLCAWYQDIDFSSPGMDPREWTAETNVCDLKPVVADYYLYPIQGLPTETAAGNSSTILGDLANQGYESQCTTPAFNVQVVEGPDNPLYIAKVGRGEVPVAVRSITAKETVDYASSEVPVLRDTNPLSSLKASLEDFWGFQNTALTSKAALEETISSSFIYSKLTLHDQCQFKLNILNTIGRMCSKLSDPQTCALYQQIPNAGSYTTQTVLNDFNATGLTCSDVAYRKYSEAQAPVVEALMKTPLYLDKAYRLAFLVVVSELKPGDPLSDFFSFFRDPEGDADPRDEVRVIAFKIPDIGTNRPEGELHYQDPFQITRDIILEEQQIEHNNQEFLEKQAAIKSAGIQTSGGPIQCDGTEACKDSLVQAVVSLVNANGQSCNANPSELEFEPSSSIQTSGGLADTDITEFSDGTNPSNNLFSSEYTTDTQGSTLQKGIFKFLSYVRIGESGANNSKVRSYLVYPVGYELSTVEASLMNFVELQTGIDLSDNPELKEYFKVNGSTQAIESSKAEVPFTDITPPCVPTDPTRPCSQKTATAELGSDQNNTFAARILGGRLGFLTRFIQQTVNNIDSGQLAFLRSCKTTEDFLLERCSGIDPTAPANPEPVNDYINTEVVDVSNCRSVPRFTAGINIDRTLPPDRFGDSCKNLGLKTTAEQANLPAVEFDNSINISRWRDGTDGDVATLCNETFYKRVACTNGPTNTGDGLLRQGDYPALIAHKVDANGQFTPAGTMTACEYIVNQAKQNGVSPRLALAMWAEESGFSAVPNNGDMGVISRGTVRSTGGIKEQLAGFLGTIKNPNYSTYLSFLLNYSGESNKSELPPVYFCNNRRFPDNLSHFYNAL